jgi:autotransporter-associated beta strand protein
VVNGPNFGGLVVANSGALGNTPQVTVVSTTGGANGGTRVTLAAGVSTPVGTTLALPTAGTTIRSDLFAAGASSWNGPVTINGDGAASPGDQVSFHGSGGFLTVNGNITSVNFDGGTLQLRGDGTGSGSAVNVTTNGFGGVINGTISLGAGTLQVNDGVTWTINSTGNTWGNSQIAKGKLRIGADNALPAGTTVRFSETPGNAILDLNGFNQTVAALTVFNNATALAIITNGSATSDSTLEYVSGFSTFGGLIADGARKLSLTVSSGTLILTNANTYTGDTLVTGGILALGVSGSISNSANINLGLGAAIDVSTRNDTTLTISAGQTLKGNGTVFGATAVIVKGRMAPGTSIGTLTIDTGDLTLQPGSVSSMEINKTANTSDQIVCSAGNITYGGILAITNLSGTLVNGDSFTLFTGTSLPSNFSGSSGSPGAGLAYSFNNGVLSIVNGGPDTNPTNITASVSGSTLTLSWPTSHLGWILQVQTNSLATGLNTSSSAWFDVPYSDASTQSVVHISPSNPSVFYRLRLPQ